MKFSMLVRVALSFALVFFSVIETSTASNSSGATAAVGRALAAFNRGDLKAWAASCTSPASVIDDFPPHTWQGATACADWSSAYAQYCKQNGVTDGIVMLGTPWHVAVTGNHAYLVYPATFTYKMHGKPIKESGAVFTLVLTKTLGTWRIAAWTWAQR